MTLIHLNTSSRNPMFDSGVTHGRGPLLVIFGTAAAR
jgi:hypothetical protein